MSLPPLEPVLARQLRKEGVTDVNIPPDEASWARLLQRISEHYRHVEEDRVRLSCSLETSTEEMTALHGRLEEERQRLRSLVLAFADALSVFRNAIPQRFSDQSVDEATSAVSQAKLKFSGRHREIIAAGGAPSGSSSIEFEALGRDLLALADQLVRLLRETAEKASLKKELEVAGAVQQMLLPERDLIERPYAKVAACYRAAAECSGDWWAAHDLSLHCLGLGQKTAQVQRLATTRTGCSGSTNWSGICLNSHPCDLSGSFVRTLASAARAFFWFTPPAYFKRCLSHPNPRGGAAPSPPTLGSRRSQTPGFIERS